MANNIHQYRRTFLKSLGVGAGIALGGSGLASRSHAAVSQVDTSVIESFEDGDLSEYTFAAGKSGATVTSSPTYDGSKVLEIADTHTQMHSTSGLNRYPQDGDIFSVWVRATDNADAINFTYGVQDDKNRYFIRVNFTGGTLAFHRYANGSSTALASDAAVSPSHDTWYELKIEWCDCAHTISLKDTDGNRLSEISATDTTWRSGGIGFDGFLSNGGTVYFDYVNLHTNTARKTHVVDTFEDGDLSEYSVVQNGSGASVVSSPTYEGSKALRMQGADTKLVSTSGLPHYPRQGSTFTFRFRPTGGADYVNFSYGVKDSDNKYLIQVNLTDGGLSLGVHENGTGTELTDMWDFSITEDVWHEVEIDWSRNGTHAITIYRENEPPLGHCSTSDSTWRSGGIGIDAFLSNGGTVHFDSVVINEYDNTGFGVVVEDFEDGNLDEYTITQGSSGATVTSNQPFEGKHTLKLSGADVSMVRPKQHSRNPTAGETFSCVVKAENGADVVQVGYGVQDSNNRYAVRIDFANNSLAFLVYKDGVKGTIKKKPCDDLKEGGWYQLEMEWLTNGRHIIRLNTGAGNVAKLNAEDTTWSDGGVGFDAYLANGGNAYIDDFTKEEYRFPQAGIVADNFGDGTLDEYRFQSGKAGATLISSPAYFGSQALQFSNTTVRMTSTTGLAAYPSVGDQFRTLVRSSNGEGHVDICYGVKNPQNKYVARMDFSKDRLQIFRCEEGSFHLLDESSATCYTHGEQWYRVIVNWKESGIHTIRILNASQDKLTQLSVKDSVWEKGGIGFNASPATNSELFVDSLLIDGFKMKLESLMAKHGPIQNTETKQVSNDKYKMSGKVTHKFEDGTTYEFTVNSNGYKSYISGSDNNYLLHVPPEKIYQNQRRLGRIYDYEGGA